MRHLTVQQISGSLDGALSGVSLELVVRHLATCHECRERHSRLTKQDDALRRLLDCDLSDVFHEDVLARLGVVLEAEARGEMPPEHALPPELAPLPPEPSPSRPMPRPPSGAVPNPAILSDEEQARRTAEELKAAEAAALSSLEELMREMRAMQEAPAAPAQPAPVPPAEVPGSLLALPPDILAALREAGSEPPRTSGPAAGAPPPVEPPAVAGPPAAPRPEPAAEPAAIEPPAATGPPRADEAAPIAIEPVGVDPLPEHVQDDAPSLSWVVVDGPLPVGPDLPHDAETEPLPGTAAPEPIAHECEAAPDAHAPASAEHETAAHAHEFAPAADVPAPLAQAPEPPAPAPPAPWQAPLPPREVVHTVELPPIHVPAPEPQVVGAEPGRVVVAAPPHSRVSPEPNPVDDPYATDDRLGARVTDEPPPPKRRVRKRHLAAAGVALVTLLVVLGGSGYLPPVIRVPLPSLRAPRLPRVEVVKVPIAGAPAPSHADAPRDGRSARAAADERAVANVVPPHATSAPPARRAPVATPPANVVREPAVRRAPAPIPSAPGRAATSAPPMRTSPPPAASAARTRPSAPNDGVAKPAPVPTPPLASPTPPPATSAPATTTPSPSASTPPATAAPAPATDSEPRVASPAPPAVDPTADWPLLCGQVVDEAGSPVAGARIALADLDIGARTDRRGRFCVAAPPGDRTLSVVAQGFATHRRIVSLTASGLEISVSLGPATASP